MIRLGAVAFAALAMALAFPVSAVTLQPGWPQSAGAAGTKIFSSPAVGDMDGDGELEVVVGSTNGGVYAWDTDGTPLPGWPQITGALIYSSPALGDLDGDGELEVVVGSNDESVYAWDTNGSPMAGWPQATAGSVESSPAVVDLDGDGDLEVLAGSDDGRVYAWHADGTAVAGWPQSTTSWVNDSPVVTDLEGDGEREVVTCSWDNRVYVWHADGTLAAGWPQSAGDLVPDSAALGDLDGDGELEIVTGSWGNTVYAWHADGTAVAGWPQTTGEAIWSCPALGDIDGDGALEVVAEVGYEDHGGVYAWHANGSLVSGWPQSTALGGYVYSTPALGDMDGNGTLEVMIGSWMGKVYAWQADGSGVPGWPQTLPDSVGSSPALGDMDGDGKLEVVAGCYDSNVYVWKCDATTTDLLPWPMFRHDARRTALYVPPAPAADFSGAPTAGLAPLSVQFTDQSSGHPTTWRWDFGDGTTSSQQNPNHEYTAADGYTVSLTAGNAGGSDTETKTDFITVAAPLGADFAADPRAGPPPLLVHFTDMPTGNPTAWSWTFGDGVTSTERNPEHTYDAAGSYTVGLTVTAGIASDTETKEDYITVTTTPPAVEAEFVGAPAAGPVPLLVQFADQSLGSITSWLWEFGDDWTSTEQDPAHTYGGPGSYTVTLTVTGPGGPDSETKLNYILATPAPPVAAFAGTPTTGPAPLLVHFTDDSTGGPTAWLWDFGDGTTSTDQHPDHIYAEPGSYTVSLIATNAGGSDGAVEEDYIIVTAVPVPEAEFLGTPTAGIAPLEVQFTDLSTRSPATWSWGFGDGATSAEQDPLHTFAEPGRHTISLTVSNSGGSNRMEKPRYLLVTFPDVPFSPEHWALYQILACVDAGIVEGYPGGLYKPAVEVTRDQMAVYISRAMAGSDADVLVPSGVMAPTFTDVAADHWAYRYVEYCAGLDIVQGYWNNTYHPEEVVNRGQMAVYVARSVVVPPGEASVPEAPAGGPTFPDVRADNDWAWCYKHVEYVAGLAIVHGYWDGYHPERAVTRDQMAVYVGRAFGLVD